MAEERRGPKSQPEHTCSSGRRRPPRPGGRASAGSTAWSAGALAWSAKQGTVPLAPGPRLAAVAANAAGMGPGDSRASGPIPGLCGPDTRSLCWRTGQGQPCRDTGVRVPAGPRDAVRTGVSGRGSPCSGRRQGPERQHAGSHGGEPRARPTPSAGTRRAHRAGTSAVDPTPARPLHRAQQSV